jgi:hypothetical protein
VRNKPQLQIAVRPPSTTIQADRQAVAVLDQGLRIRGTANLKDVRNCSSACSLQPSFHQLIDRCGWIHPSNVTDEVGRHVLYSQTEELGGPSRTDTRIPEVSGKLQRYVVKSHCRKPTIINVLHTEREHLRAIIWIWLEDRCTAATSVLEGSSQTNVPASLTMSNRTVV